ncbi:MAG TPA: hypothetical protein VHL09_13750 [Dehalococcoidia bacterium]|nr:hypothetical protein [Dehalococcoidia bacterium]
MGEAEIALIQDYQRANFSPREKAAIRFAELFALDHRAMDDAYFAGLHEHFTDPEILELGWYTGMCLAMGRLLATLDVGPASCAMPPPDVG